MSTFASWRGSTNRLRNILARLGVISGDRAEPGAFPTCALNFAPSHLSGSPLSGSTSLPCALLRPGRPAGRRLGTPSRPARSSNAIRRWRRAGEPAGRRPLAGANSRCQGVAVDRGASGSSFVADCWPARQFSSCPRRVGGTPGRGAAGSSGRHQRAAEILPARKSRVTQ